MTFPDRLREAILKAGAPACVGLDPVLERLPRELAGLPAPGAIERFSLGVLDACAGIAPVVKPQSACFERYGSAGVAALERVVAHARRLGFVVVLDAKRGDIGISAEHYAAAATAAGADAITVSGYLGPSTIEPFLKAGLGVFVLVRTSNPDSDAVQGWRLADGRTVGEMMADHVAAIGERCGGSGGLSAVGAVIGATKSSEGAALRARMPRQVFLVPGYGAQGGTAADVRALLRPNARDAFEAGVLVNASRSVLYPPNGDGPGWKGAVAAAATGFAAELRAVLGG